MDGVIQAGIPTPRSCFPQIVKEFDRDDSGDINYREFAAALKRYEVSFFESGGGVIMVIIVDELNDGIWIFLEKQCHPSHKSQNNNF